jgi:hypothetical protein
VWCLKISALIKLRFSAQTVEVGFDLARDQPIAHIGETGKTGHYINNFIFFPRRDASGLVARANAVMKADGQGHLQAVQR